MCRFFLFSITVFFCSCIRNTSTEQIAPTDKTKEIYIVSRPDSVITKVSEIAIDIEYIPLQPPAGIRMYFIDKIVAYGNKLYLNVTNDVLCFDDHGQFLNSLYYGNENIDEVNVVAIFDFDINGDTSLVVLAGNEILHFKNSGAEFEYIKTMELGSASTSNLSFVPGTNNILLSSTRRNGFETTLHILINLDGETLSYKPNYFNRFNPIKNKIWDGIIHYRHDNKLHVRERFNDSVFSIDAESNFFTPTIILNSRLSSTNSENINDPNYFKFLPNVIKIFEGPRYLFYSYNFAQRDYKIFYDKYEDKKYEIDSEIGVLKDDIVGGPDFNPLFCSEGNIYSWIRARDLKKYLESKDFTEAQVLNFEKQQDLRKLAESLNDTDNPVLIVITPKN